MLCVLIVTLEWLLVPGCCVKWDYGRTRVETPTTCNSRNIPPCCCCCWELIQSCISCHIVINGCWTNCVEKQHPRKGSPYKLSILYSGSYCYVYTRPPRPLSSRAGGVSVWKKRRTRRTNSCWMLVNAITIIIVIIISQQRYISLYNNIIPLGQEFALVGREEEESKNVDGSNPVHPLDEEGQF